MVSSRPSSTPRAPVVLRISRLAHLGVGFFTLGLLAFVLAEPGWFAPLLVIPVLLSAAIVRYRTVVDDDGLSVRTLLGGEMVRWEEIDGLRFGRGSWAVAHRSDGSELRLPAATFATLPLLTELSGGRVPNPYTQ